MDRNSALVAAAFTDAGAARPRIARWRGLPLVEAVAQTARAIARFVDGGLVVAIASAVSAGVTLWGTVSGPRGDELVTVSLMRLCVTISNRHSRRTLILPCRWNR
jgi:hypothetical protein